MSTVKQSRTYDVSRRREQAEVRRKQVLAGARSLFLDRGYVGTTIDDVAQQAGVSAAMIYKSFGSKAALLRDIRDEALTGVGTAPAETRSDEMTTAALDGPTVVASWARLAAEVAPIIHPVLLMVVKAAAGDPEVATLHHEMEAERLSRMAHNAGLLRRRGFLRPGVSTVRARDLLFTYSSPELYDVLVQRRGWSVKTYSEFLRESISSALLA